MEKKYIVYKILRKLYGILTNEKTSAIRPWDVPTDEETASQWLYQLMMSDSPCMIARFGSFELNTILNVRSIQDGNHSILDYITHKSVEWWWNEEWRHRIQNNAGFFPPTNSMLIKYKDRMFEDIKQLDVLGDFCPSVKYIEKELEGVKRVHIKDLEPFYGREPWTRALEGKKVLVVHPLADLIKDQYENNRDFLFVNKKILPKFNLEVIPAVQSLGGENTQFTNWFEALEWMEQEIDRHDYDVCLIGCGAYGFCLAAHCKRMGKKAIHLGGVLQLLFGIKGKRWEDPNYGVKEWGIPVGAYSNLINQKWIRPGNQNTPRNANNVENGCYW